MKKLQITNAPKIASFIYKLIGYRIKIIKSFNYLFRQTIRNIVLESNVNSKQLTTPETLYIIGYEKFISTQNNENKQVILKSVVTFDGNKIENKKNILKHKSLYYL